MQLPDVSGYELDNALELLKSVGIIDISVTLTAPPRRRDAGYNGSTGLIIHSATLTGSFFDLKTGIAGEILQKFSNYRMRLAIIGDFANVRSKALRDFIRESNTRGTINFVETAEEALSRLEK